VYLQLLKKKINYTIIMPHHRIYPVIYHQGSKPNNLLLTREIFKFFS